MYRAGNSVEQVFGGTVIKQGDRTPLGFNFRTENGELVYLTGSTVQIKLASDKGVVLEKAATISDEYTAQFAIGSQDITGAGDMRIEFIVTYPGGTIEKFPSDDWQRIRITPTLENVEKYGVGYITFEKLTGEFQSQFDEFTGDVDQQIDYQKQRVDNLIKSTPQPSEVVDARFDETGKSFTNLKAHLDDKGNKIGSLSEMGKVPRSLSRTLADRRLNIKDFGAKGDGVTDDTKAFKDVITAYNNLGTLTGVQSNPISVTPEIYFPPGHYKINQGALFSTLTTRRVGLCIKGSTYGTSVIEYTGSDSAAYFFELNDFVIGLVIENIVFSGVPTKSFMKSLSNGGNQSFKFKNCIWREWDKIFDLQGSNNNSEWSMYSCHFNGNINTALYIGATNTSDQFLNYEFHSCNFEVQNGTFIEAYKGGNFKVYGGSFIQISSSATKPFYKIGDGTSHARSTEMFYNNGTRYEFRAGNSMLIDCNWLSGIVHFDNINCIANEDGTGNTKVRANFYSNNNHMPIIKFDHCELGGMHQYGYNASSYQYAKTIMYIHCFFHPVTNNDLSKFFTFTTATNPGGAQAISVVECRGTGSKVQIDCEYNWGIVNRKILTKKYLTIKNAGGFNPQGTTETEYLPLGAIITGVRLFVPPGTDNTGGRTNDFTVQTSETTPIVLCQVNTGTFADGFNTKTETFFVCDTDAKRTINLINTNSIDRRSNKFLCLIEYLG